MPNIFPLILVHSRQNPLQPSHLAVFLEYNFRPDEYCRLAEVQECTRLINFISLVTYFFGIVRETSYALRSRHRHMPRVDFYGNKIKKLGFIHMQISTAEREFRSFLMDGKYFDCEGQLLFLINRPI